MDDSRSNDQAMNQSVNKCIRQVVRKMSYIYILIDNQWIRGRIDREINNHPKLRTRECYILSDPIDEWINQQLNSECLQTWWRYQIETFSALLALCERKSTVTSEFLLPRSVSWSFDIFFELLLNKQLSKHSWGWWFEMPSPSCDE